MLTTTHGIEYPEGTDAITDYPGVAAAAAAAIDAMLTGWIPLGAALTYATTDGHTFTATAPVDLTASVSVGMRVRLVHGAATKYFIVTAIAFAGGVTTLTLYGGTDYALAAGAITLPYFSPHKAPVGFPLDPTKWTETLDDTSDRLQATPAGGTWYNPGSLSIAIPIGAWDLTTEYVLYGDRTNANLGIVKGSLSTNAAAETDTDLTSAMQHSSTGSTTQLAAQDRHKRKLLVLAAKTTYYLVCTMSGAGNNVGFAGTQAKTKIRARCAYL